MEAVRDEADTQGQSLLALARATFTVSKSEAGAYFDRAIEILSRIGDENVPRWECFLHLAAVAEAPGVVRAETAYRMSRIGELTRSLVVRDKYFDWDGTVEALAGLDPASLLTLLSRWRDRRFGDEERLLSEAVEAMSKRGHADQRLPFYEFHARQWLLLGLNRAAVDGFTPLSAETVALARTWLETDHVLIRGLAADLILKHERSGGTVLDSAERRRLETINHSQSAPDGVSRSDYDADGDDSDTLDETYAFGLDAGRYMFAPLGHCFGASTARVEHMATIQAKRVFGLEDRESLREDPRHQRGIFDSMETYAGQGMTPISEGFRDYCGYHALMFTAGKLLRTRPRRIDPYAEPGGPDEFSQRLKREGLTRTDGRWVSDRRDPVRLPPCQRRKATRIGPGAGASREAGWMRWFAVTSRTSASGGAGRPAMMTVRSA